MGIQQMMLTTASSLSASTFPSTLSNLAGNSSTVYTTGATTVTVTDSIGAVSYSWVKVSGDDINASLVSNATTDFFATGMAFSEVRFAIFKCVVTDSVGSVDTNTVTISLQRLT